MSRSTLGGLVGEHRQSFKGSGRLSKAEVRALGQRRARGEKVVAVFTCEEGAQANAERLAIIGVEVMLERNGSTKPYPSQGERPRLQRRRDAGIVNPKATGED